MYYFAIQLLSGQRIVQRTDATLAAAAAGFGYEYPVLARNAYGEERKDPARSAFEPARFVETRMNGSGSGRGRAP